MQALINVIRNSFQTVFNHALPAAYVTIVLFCAIHYLRRDIGAGSIPCLYCTVMISFITLRGKFWAEPLDALWHGWGVHNRAGTFTLEGPLNILLFVPFGFMLYTLKEWKIYQIVGCSFLLSLGIEVTQVIFYRGTLQIADLTYNTVGGILGGIIYLRLRKSGCLHKHRSSKDTGYPNE